MNFERIDSAPWIDQAEARLPFSLPRCLGDFLRKYTFSEFEIAGLHHYDNYASFERWCWVNAVFRDEAIFQICSANKFLPVGQPEEGNYDRICLDLNRMKSGDCPVVQLDHEAILLKEKIKIVRELAPSYAKLVAKVLDAYFQCDPRATLGK